MNFNKLYIALLFGATVMASSCSDDDSDNLPSVDAPDAYVFTRNGSSSVSYDGQTTRIAMTQELGTAIKDETKTKEELLAMFAHEAGDADFTDTDLNASDKNIRSKVAASADLFASNTTDATAIKSQLDTWIEKQEEEVFPRWNEEASAGEAGQLVDGGSARYVSADGLEYNQLLAKSLIGALFADQVINNYLSTAVLDAGTNQEDNDADVVEEGENYTSMEHKWDEAYGYVYGAAEGKSYLLSYIDQVAENENYATIATDIEQAFILGRAAIVAKNYTVRDAQAEIIREKVSQVIAIRGVHYLQAGKSLLAAKDFGGAFHDLSEGLGFVYSLQFTRKPNTTEAYFTKAEVDGFFDDILANEHGLWNASATTLDEVSQEIVDALGLTLAEAAE
ncbi:DUF4856 domain-containing protein [Reichenbachiella carrageenanivorans]|uniref:DUF4856 domain-containing protein n=1 Tax=Reichenbachiella carrageenanivorans TaxID=2979869 RepID=A0ABY6CXH3_9BACT|nr:DUF4856 domain-containing protein [Reichenbachiella carrageenanivorans]UXX78563.1 DUF4856 domain-containing protein [Reichenbachiella carrageenanivorans]